MRATSMWSLQVVVLGLFALALCACGSSGKTAADDGEKKGDGDLPTIQARTTDEGIDAGTPSREGEDWPQFLGPLGTSVSRETGLAETWPKDGLPVLWEKTIGTGYSAPSIVGNRLVMHHRLGRREIVECLRADNGESIWKLDYRSDYSDPYGYNDGPRCSPVLTEDRCYTFGAEGKLVCCELKTGKQVWARDVKADFNLPQWFFGIGCSPILEGDLIIALVGGQPNAGVVAFNAKTGETVWQAMGKETWDGAETGWREKKTYEWSGEEQVVSYSSPYVATIHGKKHLLVLGRQGLVSLDPATGKQNFKHWFMSKSFESVNAARPVVVDDTIFLSAAYKVGSVLLKVKPDGKSYDVVWRDAENMLNHWSTSIPVDGYIYGFSGRHEPEGEFRCLDLKTGNVEWSTTGFAGNQGDVELNRATGESVDKKTGAVIPFPFYGRGSLTKIGDRFLVLGERGTLALVKINPEKWEELARTSYKQITYPVWTAPVVCRKRVYLRDEDTLLCLDIAPPRK